MAPLPQLAQFEATSSAGGFVMDHRALLMMKDPKEPQLWQASPLSSISWRTHPACPPETYMPATKLPVLLLCGGLNATGIHRPRALASRAGEPSRRRG